MQDVQEAAHVKGMQLQVLRAGDKSEITAAFATVVENCMSAGSSLAPMRSLTTGANSS